MNIYDDDTTDADDRVTDPIFYMLQPPPEPKAFVAKLAAFAFVFCLAGYFLMGCGPRDANAGPPPGGRDNGQLVQSTADDCCEARQVTGAFQRLVTPESTSSTSPDLFWSVPFTLSEAGDVWATMTYTVFITNDNAGPGTFVGGNFTAEIDSVPLPDISAVNLETQPGPNFIVSWVASGTLQTAVTGLAAGAHDLDIFWSTHDEDCTMQIAPGEANIRIGAL